MGSRTRRGLLVALCFLAATLVSSCTIEVSPSGEPAPEEPVSAPQTPQTNAVVPTELVSPTPTPTPTATSDPPSSEELARGVVRIAQVDGEGQECASGSGTLLDASGFILTNFHVVEYAQDAPCPYEELRVSLTESPDAAPEPRFRAVVLAFDPGLDLAVIGVDERLDGLPLDEPLPYLELGDSDSARIGDPVTVLGYPGIGGETITLTNGQISGFLGSQELGGSRAWIKTATTIAGGNSGGAAIDEMGRLIGIPTRAGAGEDEQVVDCRIIEDTNNDGDINSIDSCIPIGGFINGLRPVNLALPLLAEAATSSGYAIEDVTRAAPLVTAEVRLFDLQFSGDVVDNEPGPIAASLPGDSGQICGFFSYENMTTGALWDAIWTVDGELNEGASYVGEVWEGEESGTTWVCALGGDEGLASGLWELAVFVDSEEPLISDAIYVGDQYSPTTLEVVNGLGEEICRLRVSPSDYARWGQDDLGSATLIPGESVVLEVGASTYDLQARTCDGTLLADERGLEVLGPTSFTVE